MSEIWKYKKQLQVIKQHKEIQHVQLSLENCFPNKRPETSTIEIQLTETWKEFGMAHAEMLVGKIFSLHYSNEFLWYRVYTEPMTIVFTVHNSNLMLLLVNSVKMKEAMKQWGVVGLKIDTICVLKTSKDSEKEGKTILDRLFKGHTIKKAIQVRTQSKLPKQLRRHKKWTTKPFKLPRITNNQITQDTVVDYNNNFCINYDDDSNLLMIACCNDNTEIVKLLLDKGADPNAVNVSGWTALMYASIVGNIRIVNMLLTHSAATGVTNFHNETALTYASLAGKVEVVKLLLNKRDNPDSMLTTENTLALFNASKKNHLQVVKVLLQSQDYNKTDVTQTTTSDDKIASSITPLYIASKKSHSEIVEELLKANIDPNIKCDKKGTNTFICPGLSKIATPLYAATKRGHLSIVQKLLSAKANPSDSTTHVKPLIRASYEGYLKIIELLLQAGAHPNEVGQYKTMSSRETTALQIACESGNLAVVDALLNTGINLNKNDRSLTIAVSKGFLDIAKRLLTSEANPNEQFDSKNTPLLIATENSDIPMMELLLKAQADPNIPYNSFQPLQAAATTGNVTAFLLLLDAGANPNYVGKYGNTSLNFAARYGKTKILNILLSKEVNVNNINYDGDTALHDAAEFGYWEIVDILLKKGANPNIQRFYDGATPLHFSIMARHRNMSKSLLQHKAIPDIFLLDLEENYFQGKQYNNIVLFLKSKGDPTYTCEPYPGFTALHIATMFNEIELVQLLIDYNANKTLKNAFGQTALVTAQLLQYHHIAVLLEK